MKNHEQNEKRKATKERGDLRERLSRALDIPPDLFPGGSLVEIRGQNALCVRGGGRILYYTDEEIRVALRHAVLSVRGRRLVCTAYCQGALGIDGLIESVCFCPPSFEKGKDEKGGTR